MTKIIIKNSEGETIKELEQDIKKTLIKQMTDAGVEVMAACHHGICGACIYKINAGEEGIVKNFKGEPGFPLSDEEVMTCIAGVKGTDKIELQENTF